MWSAFFALLTITIIAVFPLYDEQRAEELFRYIEIQMGVPLKYYHYESIRFMEIFIHKTKLWTNYTRELLEQTYQEYVLEATSDEQKRQF
jgi:hypothetical protein